MCCRSASIAESRVLLFGESCHFVSGLGRPLQKSCPGPASRSFPSLSPPYFTLLGWEDHHEMKRKLRLEENWTRR